MKSTDKKSDAETRQERNSGVTGVDNFLAFVEPNAPHTVPRTNKEAAAGFVQQSPIVVEGVNTDVVVYTHSDRYFVVITQVGHVATLIDCCIDDEEGSLVGARVVLGDRSRPVLLAYASAIMKHVATKSQKPVLLGIGLKTDSAESFNHITAHVRDKFVF
eukprot:Lankesteria_metandrocarpae@DN5399_c0_g2_i1.p1